MLKVILYRLKRQAEDITVEKKTQLVWSQRETIQQILNIRILYEKKLKDKRCLYNA